MTQAATPPPVPDPARALPRRPAGPGSALALICLGVALTLLSLPPGPLPALVLVADVPFLLLLFRRAGNWKRWTFVYGALWFGFTLRWLSEVHPVEVPAAAVVLGPTFLVVGALLRLLTIRFRAPFVVSVGLVLVLEEMLRTVWMGGMPWPMRSLAFASGQMLSPFPDALVMGAGLLGAYALTFVAATTSAVVSGVPAWWQSAGAERRRLGRSLLLGLAWPVGLVLVLYTYGTLRESDFVNRRDSEGSQFVSKQELIAIQGNVPQALKNAASGKKILHDHIRLSAAALETNADGSVFGVVWPETMVLWPFYEPALAARFPDRWDDGEVSVMRRIRSDVLDERDLHFFVGAIARTREDEHVYEDPHDYGERDSMFHVRPQRGPRRGEAPGARPDASNPRWFPPWGHPRYRHDKVRLVPGGEYMPLGDVFPALRTWRRKLVPIPELTAGDEHQPPFQVQLGAPWIEGPRPPGSRVLSVGTIICFDLAFPERVRTWRADGAEVLLNAANYGWFGPTDFVAQVQAMARLRAAESNTTIVVAGNTGPSVFVDPVGRLYGRFVAWNPRDGASLPVPAGGLTTSFQAGWAQGRVVADPYVPPYVLYGDLPWAAAGLLLLGWTLLRHRRRQRAGR